MRSQANGWAACVSSEIDQSRVLRGFPSWKAALPEAIEGEPRGDPAGWLARGTLKEDGPVTWEAPDRPVGGSGRRRTGDPLRRAAGGKRPAAGLVAADAIGHRNSVCPTGKARPREDRRRANAAGESEGRIRAMKRGNG